MPKTHLIVGWMFWYQMPEAEVLQKLNADAHALETRIQQGFYERHQPTDARAALEGLTTHYRLRRGWILEDIHRLILIKSIRKYACFSIAGYHPLFSYLFIITETPYLWDYRAFLTTFLSPKRLIP